MNPADVIFWAGMAAGGIGIFIIVFRFLADEVFDEKRRRK